MMFQATLDSVSFQLDDAQKTTSYAVSQLSQIGALTWNSQAGKALVEQVGQLCVQLQALTRTLDDAEAWLAASARQIQLLEAQIISQQAAG